MTTITSLGVGSGLDLTGLLDSLTTAEQQKLTPITDQQDANSAKISAYGSLQSALSSLQNAVQTLTDTSTYQALTSSLSGSGITSAVTSSAVPGNYQITVNSLAQANSLATAGVADKTTALGTGDLTLSVGGTSTTITLDSTNNTLEGIRDAINAQGAGVTASIINTGDATNPYRLTLTSDTTGTASAISVSLANGTGTVSSLFASGALTETVAAQDASLTVNGIAITSQSNTVEGALQGVTLNLSLSSVGQTQTLSVARDTESMKSAITDFVDTYNALMGTTDALTAYNADPTQSGKLLGDGTERTIENRLTRALTADISGSTFQHLQDLGISLQSDGTLQVDDTKLSAAVNGDNTALSNFFVGSGSGSGFANNMSNVLDGILGDQGILTTATDSLQAANDRLDQQYTDMQSSIDATIAIYKTQFTALDTLIAQLNSTSTYLTQQFSALSSSSSKSS